MTMELLEMISFEQLIVTALTITAAGVIGFWCKDVPIKIYQFIIRQCTTTISITTAHRSFYNLLGYIEENYKGKNFRNFKLTNGKWGNNENATVGIGYGGHFLKFGSSFLYVQLERQDSQGTELDKETITITRLGRNRKGFEKLFKAITVDKEIENTIQVYKMDDYWYPVNRIHRRTFETVFLEQDKKNKLLKAIDNFVKNEKWYLENGIPYHLGILLYGSPGTGKSSLIKAIASYLNYDIYYLPVKRLYKIEDSMCTLPDKSIIVIEDIDCEKTVHSRGDAGDNDDKTPLTKKVSISEESDNMLSIVNFSDILNAIDGICSTHGRILITTTNHIEKLDPALIRPGRIDVKVELGYVNTEIFNQFTMRFFDKSIGRKIVLRECLTCAELQDMMLQGKSLKEIVDCATIENILLSVDKSA